MARLYNGSINYPLTFNVGNTAPLDSRAAVEYTADLINAETWPDTAPAYKDMAVVVDETGDLWILRDVTKVTNDDYSGWKNLTQALINDNATSGDTKHTFSADKILNLIGNIAQFNVVKVISYNDLPATGDTHTIYLVPNSGSGTNTCDEYLYFNNNYELIGNTQISVGTLDTTATTAQTTSSNESLSGNITLHKVSKTGSYSDLLNTPTIPAAANDATYSVKTDVSGTETTVSDFTANQSTDDSVTFVQGSNVTLTPDATNKKITIAATDNDTKNTAGSNNYTELMYLLGTHTQSDYETSYSNSKLYATDGRLHASGLEIMNSVTDSTGSIAAGSGCRTRVANSYALGVSNVATNNGELAIGLDNISHKPSGSSIIRSNVSNVSGSTITITENSTDNLSPSPGNEARTLYSIGCGTNNSNPSNLLEIMRNGDVYLNGVGNYDGTHIKKETGAPTGLKTLQEVLQQPATASSLGLVKVGSGLNVDNSGTLSVQSASSSQGGMISADQYKILLYAPPIGTIVMWGGSTAPAGWLLCDGTKYNYAESSGNQVINTEYKALYDVIGKTYKKYTWQTIGGITVWTEEPTLSLYEFRVPDLRGRFPLGSDPNNASEATGHTAHTLGQQAGDEKVTLTAAQSGLPSHTHDVKFSSSDDTATVGGSYSRLTGSGSSVTITSESTGGSKASTAHNNLPPFTSVNFIIKYL